MRFLIDMNLSPRWVSFLQAAGHEAVHWITVGALDASDQIVLEHARSHGLVIVTQDLDFGTLLAVGGLAAPSVIQFRAQAVLPEDVGQQLLRAVDVANDHLQSGALITVDAERHRVSVLPFAPEDDTPGEM